MVLLFGGSCVFSILNLLSHHFLTNMKKLIILFIILLVVEAQAGDYGKDTVWTHWSFDRINTLDISPDGSRILAALNGKKDDVVLKLYESTTGEMLSFYVKDVEDKETENIAKFLPDGSAVVARVNLYSLQVFNPNTLELIKEIEFEHVPIDFCFSPDSKIMYVGNYNDLIIYDTQSWTVIDFIEDLRVWKIDVSPDGRYLACKVKYTEEITLDYYLWIYDLEQKEVKHSIYYEGLEDIFISPLSNTVVVNRYNIMKGKDDWFDPLISQYDLTSGEKIKDFEKVQSRTYDIAFSKYGEFIVTADSKMGSMKTYSVVTGKIDYEYSGFQGGHSAVVVTPDNNFICSNGIFTLWHARWGEVGVDDIIPEENIIFPNPSSDFVTISLPETRDPAEYQLIDMQGRVLERGSTTEGQLELDLSHYASGVYFLKVSTGGNVITHKLVRF